MASELCNESVLQVISYNRLQSPRSDTLELNGL